MPGPLRLVRTAPSWSAGRRILVRRGRASAPEVLEGDILPFKDAFCEVTQSVEFLGPGSIARCRTLNF